MRDYESLPDYCSNDIDILVHPEYADYFCSIISDVFENAVVLKRFGVHSVSIVYNEIRFTIDLIHICCKQWLPYCSTEGVLSRAIDYQGIPVLSVEDEFLIVVIKEHLTYGKVRSKKETWFYRKRALIRDLSELTFKDYITHFKSQDLNRYLDCIFTMDDLDAPVPKLRRRGWFNMVNFVFWLYLNRFKK